MRPALIVLAGACAAVTTSLAMWFAIRAEASAWCELVDQRLVRTNASELQVTTAVLEALRQHQPPGRLTEARLDAIEYGEHAEAWFTDPDFFGTVHERASRLVREQLDEHGKPLRVEVLRGAGMPTLVFIQHEKSDSGFAREITDALAAQGIRLM